MVPKTNSKNYEIIHEGQEEILRIHYENVPYTPSIENNELVMMDLIDKLIENPSISRVTFVQRRHYNYDFQQTQILLEIANLYSYFVKSKKVLSLYAMGSPNENQSVLAQRRALLQKIVFNLLRKDPIGAYVEIKRQIRTEHARLKQMTVPQQIHSQQIFIKVLEHVYEMLDKTKLIQFAKADLAGYDVGDRSIYRSIFRPAIMPDFMFTKVMASPPIDGEQQTIYRIDKDSEVTIYETKDDIKYLYHLIPPEFKLTEDKYALIDLAKSVLSEHQPKEEEFLDPDKMRVTFANIGQDLIRELANSKGIDLSVKEVKQLTEILIRQTIGFGMIELLLADTKVQDITINAPIGQSPIFLLHDDYGECYTNLWPSPADSESWAAKLRLLSGRPLDEANPILDTELSLPSSRSRISVINKPLNPYGLAYAFRRHRDTPWTLPLFVQNRMISPLAAGLLSFLIQGSRTMLVAGTRSSGKTSLLGACLVEIMRKYRIISIEDTLELPTSALRELGFNIQPMKVRSALVKGGAELSASEGIRASLRLGDSSLIVGEVRSEEAVALYEAMRIGALANVVAGTIHGDSPYGVFDRVVNDLGVPRTSFKATDIIVVCNPLKSPDGLHKWRRVTQITEVRKTWEEDPLAENGFVDLMRYNAETDQLEPTPDLMNGESEILKSIGANVKEWVGDWDAIWDNIQLRAKIKQSLVEYSKKMNNPKLLEAKFVVLANDEMNRISEEVREEEGSLDNKKIYFEWKNWLKRIIKVM